MKNKETAIRSSAAEYLSFAAAAGGDNPKSVEMRYEDENIWLTQKMMATLYEVEIPTINEHLRHIFEDKEIQTDSVIRNFLITAADGKKITMLNTMDCRQLLLSVSKLIAREQFNSASGLTK
jgi:hypothetical protein